MPLLSLLACCLLCWLCCAATAAAGAEPSPPLRTIWSGLVLATNDPHPAQAPPRLRQFAGKLKNIFGYNQFELVGEYSEKMDDPYERWLIPSKDFCLSVKTRNEPGKHYPMRIVLFQNRRRLAEFEAHLNPESPLFIRGPLYAGGQLVIVLHVADPSEIPERLPRPAVLPVNPVSNGAALKEKERSNNPIPPSLSTIPKQTFNPGPIDRFGPTPGERPAGIDSKLGKP